LPRPARRRSACALCNGDYHDCGLHFLAPPCGITAPPCGITAPPCGITESDLACGITSGRASLITWSAVMPAYFLFDMLQVTDPESWNSTATSSSRPWSAMADTISPSGAGPTSWKATGGRCFRCSSNFPTLTRPGAGTTRKSIAHRKRCAVRLREGMPSLSRAKHSGRSPGVTELMRVVLLVRT
jgi:hypothetical protein